MANADVTAARLRVLVNYSQETGQFTRLVDSYRRVAKAGDACGYLCGNGYLYLPLDGKRYLAHRLAWLHVHGVWPVGQIDHINMIRTDNRLCNLREVSARVNNENREKPQSQNKIGLRGVSWHDHSKMWRSRITVKGVEMRLGLHATPEAAHAAYIHAKRSLHEGCTI